MKKTIYTLLAMLSLATGIAAQNYIYIYRNDGQFHAFRKADIDSITWSRQDADGQEQQNWQAQWVHHKTGSVTRIPLSAIDHAATPQPAVGEAVDLGLSVNWASHNVGAASPEQAGGYYAWGETEEKAVYDKNTYAYYKSGTGYIHIGDNISGTQYDVARVKWGGKWRMPTLDEILELIDKCTWEWISYRGVDGQLVTGPNGNSIFLPAAGDRWGENLNDEGSLGYYWSGTLYSSHEGGVYNLRFASGGRDWISYFREVGLTVRPVIGKAIEIKVRTGDATSITTNAAVVSGYASGLENAQESCDLGIQYGRSAYLAASTSSIYVSSGQKTDGNFSVSLSGLAENTTYYYRARLTLGGKYYYGEVRSFTTKEEGPTEGEIIDLGLSVKWASHNVGAFSPEQAGGYYAWGETKEKAVYNWDTYAYLSSKGYVHIGNNISGTQYDVAHVKWGGKWRMPTLNEIKELCDKCTWKWTTYKGIKGYLVTGPNGNSIFLPTAGYRWDENLNVKISHGGYWSGTFYSDFKGYAYCLLFNLHDGYLEYGYNESDRATGRTVRPVTE